MVRRYSIHVQEQEQTLHLLPSQQDWNSDNKKCTSHGTKSQRLFSSTMFNLVGIIRIDNGEWLQELQQNCKVRGRRLFNNEFAKGKEVFSGSLARIRVV